MKCNPLLKTVYNRDRGICHLCGTAVSITHTHKDSYLAPSVDHLVARSENGHSNLDNLKLAHRICNNIRATLPITDEVKLKCLHKILDIRKQKKLRKEENKKIDSKTDRSVNPLQTAT